MNTSVTEHGKSSYGYNGTYNYAYIRTHTLIVYSSTPVYIHTCIHTCTLL